MDPNQSYGSSQVHWASSVTSPPSASSRKKIWRPEGSWIMLDEQERFADERERNEQTYLDNQDEIDLDKISNELRNLVDSDSNLHQLDARERMESAELSLGLSLNLGVSRQELEKSSEMVEAMSYLDKGNNITLIHESTDGKESPFSRSSSCSLDESSSYDDHSIPSISRAFSPGIWHNDDNFDNDTSREASSLKYGGRAPPILGALAPPVRGLGGGRLAAEQQPNVHDYEANNTDPRIGSQQFHPNMSWVDTGVVSLESSSLSPNSASRHSQKRTCDQAASDSILHGGNAPKDDSTLINIVHDRKNDGESRDQEQHALEQKAVCDAVSFRDEDAVEITQKPSCENSENVDGIQFKDSESNYLDPSDCDQNLSSEVCGASATPEEKGTESRVEVDQDTDNTLPTESMVMVDSVIEVPGTEETSIQEENSKRLEEENMSQTPSESSCTSTTSSGTDAPKKKSKSHRRRMKREKAKRRKALAESKPLLQWHEALWQQSLEIGQRVGLKTVAPLVVTHVVTLLFGVYLGHQYYNRTRSVHEGASDSTSVQHIPAAVQ